MASGISEFYSLLVILVIVYFYVYDHTQYESKPVFGFLPRDRRYHLSVVQTIYVTFKWELLTITRSTAVLPLCRYFGMVAVKLAHCAFGRRNIVCHQNIDTYEMEPDCLSISHAFKRAVSLAVMSMVVKNFYQGKEPLTAHEISHQMDIPIRLARQVLFELAQVGLVCEVKSANEKTAAYQPAKDVNMITVKYVIDSLEHKGSEAIVVDPAYINGANAALAAFSQAIENSGQNKLVKDL